MPITGFLYNRSNFFIVFILIIIFLLTSETFNYYESITNGYSDIKTYYDISSNGFDENLGDKNTQHRLERWPIHISIHYISKITKIGIWDLYRSFILLIMLSAFFIINTLRTTSPLIKICLWSYLTFNPFSFRLYYLAPGMIADSLLFLSFTIFVCGVINKNNFQMILSIIISNLSKQTALLLVPFLLILYYNKMISKRNLLSYVILVFLIFTFVKLSTISFFGAQNNNYFTHHLIGLFLWLKNDFSINQFIYFFGRYVFFLMTLSPLLIIGKFKVSSIFLLFFILISLQPILGGPTSNRRKHTKIISNRNSLLHTLFFKYGY